MINSFLVSKSMCRTIKDSEFFLQQKQANLNRMRKKLKPCSEKYHCFKYEHLLNPQKI